MQNQNTNKKGFSIGHHGVNYAGVPYFKIITTRKYA